MTQPEIGFTYRDQWGTVTIFSQTFEGDDLDRMLLICTNFLKACGYAESNVEDAILNLAHEYADCDERTEFLRRAFKPAEWTPEAAKSANDSAEMVQDAIDRMRKRDNDPMEECNQVIYCSECGSLLQFVRPGKWQCPRCG